MREYLTKNNPLVTLFSHEFILCDITITINLKPIFVIIFQVYNE